MDYGGSMDDNIGDEVIVVEDIENLRRASATPTTDSSRGR